MTSFGDGSHRRPDERVAIEGSDVFPRRPTPEDLRVERKPPVSWNDLAVRRELRGFTMALG